MPALTLNQLGRSFGDYRAVHELDLEVADGEFLSLLGPSGCGKTTTLRMIAGFIPPTDGTIEVGGTVLSSPKGSLPPEKRQMSMIFQSYAIWPNMTVAQNVAFGLKLRKLGSSEIRDRVNSILEVVQLAHLADQYPAELSGGQQQRVALARAIVVRPAVLLLDEPLSNLDASLREEMRYEIRRLHDEFKITTVYVTHDQSEAMATSDRIAVMNGGRIEQVDAPFEIYRRPRTRFVAGFIGRTNFIEARRDASGVSFPGFCAPAAMFQKLPEGPELHFSVRPQSIMLTAARPDAAEGRVAVPARLTERTFLGETWDYVVQIEGGGLTLRVSARPRDVHEIGERLWLEIDPEELVPIL